MSEHENQEAPPVEPVADPVEPRTEPPVDVDPSIPVDPDEVPHDPQVGEPASDDPHAGQGGKYRIDKESGSRVLVERTEHPCC